MKLWGYRRGRVGRILKSEYWKAIMGVEVWGLSRCSFRSSDGKLKGMRSHPIH